MSNPNDWNNWTDAQKLAVFKADEALRSLHDAKKTWRPWVRRRKIDKAYLALFMIFATLEHMGTAGLMTGMLEELKAERKKSANA